jgi:Leucine-rich repeat (LRR) protein
MQLSHELMLKRVPSITRPSRNKNEIDTANFSHIIGLAGPIQRLLDISKLSALDGSRVGEIIGQCVGLMHLNLGYTPIEDISPICGFSVLQTLSLAGCPLSDYTPISSLESLHVLSLRASNISSTDPLKWLLRLRSLDLGQCSKIDDIMALQPLTRLEELSLDSSGFVDVVDEAVSETLEVISCVTCILPL